MLAGGRGVAGKNTAQRAEGTFPKKYLSGAYCHACKHLVLLHWFAPRRPLWVHDRSLVMTAAATQKKGHDTCMECIVRCSWTSKLSICTCQHICTMHVPESTGTCHRRPLFNPSQHMIGDSPWGFVNSSVSAANAWTYIWSEWFVDVVEFTYASHSTQTTSILATVSQMSGYKNSLCGGLLRLHMLWPLATRDPDTWFDSRIFEWQEQRFWHLYRSMPHRMSNATYHGGPTAPHVFESLRFVPHTHTHTLAC